MDEGWIREVNGWKEGMEGKKTKIGKWHKAIGDYEGNKIGNCLNEEEGREETRSKETKIARKNG